MLRAATADMDVGRDEAVLRLNQNNERVLQRQLEATRDRFQVGEVTRTDVAQAESRLSRATADRNSADGERAYTIAPRGLKAGDTVMSGAEAPIAPGNCLPLRSIPVGSVVHNVELQKGRGAQIARAAGASVQIIAREGDYATLRLRSGEMRKVHSDCRAVIGEVGNSDHNLRSLGKAGAKRWRGIRPTVRGVAMNPVDHPHGGGEGRTSGGRHPVSPWGTPTKGYKTRNNKRTDGMIVRRRGRK